MIRRLLFALTSAVLAVALVVPVASAAEPTKTTEPFSGSIDRPAGTTCDFHYTQTYSGTDRVIEFSDRVEIHETITIVHANADTGYTLTDSDVVNYTFYSDGSFKVVGLLFHLRDASGKVVLVQSGQLIFDPDGNVIKHSADVNPSGRAGDLPRARRYRGTPPLGRTASRREPRSDRPAHGLTSDRQPDAGSGPSPLPPGARRLSADRCARD